MNGKYIGLTGATGLLGSYLLRDLLVAGARVAVLVRGHLANNAQSRIETILHHFEKKCGYPIARPVVIESDLSLPELGVSKENRQWMTRHVDTVLHNAASLEFSYDNKTGEPFKSNLEGTKKLLELCRTCSIKRLHYVSTAYVCGLRNDRVLENELDLGQQFGNVYEKSKFQAETIVRQTRELDSLTVFRPAIIVGDSQTGHTPTFHGFYTPLKILHPLIDGKDITPQGIAEILTLMGMSGTDEKNFVPVNWISQVMTHIITHPEWHERCYHLVPNNRTRIDLMCDVLAEALQKKERNVVAFSKNGNESAKNLFETFMTQMNVYKAYWRNDPEFDSTNTHQAAGHLPCPAMDRDRLRLLMIYAISSNFGWPKPRPETTDFDVAAWLQMRCKSMVFHDDLQCVGLQIVGSGGGDWSLSFQKEGQIACHVGLPCDATPTARLSVALLELLMKNTLQVHQLQPGSIAWENTDDTWIKRVGNPLLYALTGN